MDLAFQIDLKFCSKCQSRMPADIIQRKKFFHQITKCSLKFLPSFFFTMIILSEVLLKYFFLSKHHGKSTENNVPERRSEKWDKTTLPTSTQISLAKKRLLTRLSSRTVPSREVPGRSRDGTGQDLETLKVPWSRGPGTKEVQKSQDFF